MAVKINPKQQQQFAALRGSDPKMAQAVGDAMKVLNGFPFNIEAGMVQVSLALDVSGSAQPLYKKGLMQNLVEQFLAVAFLFDDNGEVPIYPFDEKVYRNGDDHPYRRGRVELPVVTLDNYRGYIDRYVADLVYDGTYYGPAIEAVANELRAGGVGFCGFFTDGKNMDERSAADALRRASSLPLFFQFAGVNEHQPKERDFPFLQQLDNLSERKLDNAGFYVAKLGEDNQIMMRRLLAEFAGMDPKTGGRSGQPAYPEKARNAGLVNDNFQWDGRRRL